MAAVADANSFAVMASIFLFTKLFSSTVPSSSARTTDEKAHGISSKMRVPLRANGYGEVRRRRFATVKEKQENVDRIMVIRLFDYSIIRSVIRLCFSCVYTGFIDVF